MDVGGWGVLRNGRNNRSNLRCVTPETELSPPVSDDLQRGVIINDSGGGRELSCCKHKRFS